MPRRSLADHFNGVAVGEQRSWLETLAVLRPVLEAVLQARLALAVRELSGEDALHAADDDAWAELMGRPAPELAGRSDLDLGVARETAALLGERCREAAATGRSTPFDLAWPAPGVKRVLTCRVAPLPDRAGGPRHVVLAAELGGGDGVVEGAVARADRLVSLGVLAAALGHDIKNLASLTDVVLQEALQQAEAAQHAWELPLERVRDDLRVALEGVRAVTVVARDIQQLAVEREECDLADLNAVVTWVLKLAAAHLGARAALVTHLEAAPPVRGNTVRLGQVVLNLVMNAAQAVEGRAARGRVWVETAARGERVVLTVSDDGPGISPEVRQRLFEPFVTSRPAQGGTGLGLHVARRIVEQVGGSLELHDRPGGGTRAVVTLPAARRAR
jgi:two-component system NtrC family sensor kinase